MLGFGRKLCFLKFLMASTYYPPYHLGGDAVHVKYLAEELVRLGHEVTVVYSSDAYFFKRRNLPKDNDLNLHGVKVYDFKSSHNSSFYFAYLLGSSFVANQAFNSIAKQVKPDVLHYHNIALFGYGILKKRSAPIIYTAHDQWLICPKNTPPWSKPNCSHSSCVACCAQSKRIPQLWRHSRSFKKDIACIDLLIAPSQYIQKRLCQKINVKSAVIRNFSPPPPSCIFEIPSFDYFLFVGVLEQHKGILKLLEIFRKSHSKIGAKLLIVGDGSLKAYIQASIRQGSFGDSVQLLGPINDRERLYSLYHGALALILPSICPENSPLVIIESLSVGTPAIVSNLGGLPEIAEKVDRKLIFNDFHELENILVNFSKSRYNCANLMKIFEDNFSADAYAFQYLRLVERLTEETLQSPEALI